MKNILVTGCAGLLGKYVIEEIINDYRVQGLDIRPPSIDMPYTLGSIDDPYKIQQAMKGVDTVIHLAAMANIFAGSPEQIMSVNTLGVWNIMQAAEAAGVRRVVLCSSDSATGFTLLPSLMKKPEYLPVDERHPRYPVDPYGLSKSLGESIGESFAIRGYIEVIVLRPVYILYPYVYEEIIKRGRDPENYIPSPEPGAARAGGGPFWHYVLPEDVAKAFRRAIELESVKYETFFVSSQETLSPIPTLERVVQLWGELPEIRTPSIYKDNPFSPLFDITHSNQVLNFATGPSSLRYKFTF